MVAGILNMFFFIFVLLTTSSPLASSRLISSSSSTPENHRRNVGTFPPNCNRIECPKFEVIQNGNEFEIRRYNSSVWMSTSPIEDISLVNATRAGFLQLFDYIQGKNEYKKKIEMTAPVLTQVSPSDGPFCSSSFVVSFYVPAINQLDTPPAQNLHAQRWGLKYVAVRQFSGFVTDSNVGEEAAALQASLVASGWSLDAKSEYIVAQYNSPFQFSARVNEIWLTVLDVEDLNVQSR